MSPSHQTGARTAEWAGSGRTVVHPAATVPPWPTGRRCREAAQDHARRVRDADPLVQHHPRPAGAAAAAAAPRHACSRSGPDDLAPLFPMDLILQEVTGERYIDIPGEVLDVYRQWRPSPLFRAHRLEKALGTPARIYYKYEGVSPAGSHKPNTAVPQAYYNAKEGVTQADHRDRRRPVGHGAGVRLRAVRPRVRGVAGRGVVRPEAVPPPDDRDVRRHRAPLAVRPHRGRAGAARSRTRTTPARWASRSPRPSRWPRRTRRRPVRARLGAQPRAAAPDDHRRGGAAAAGEGRRDARPASSAAPAAARTSPACRSRSCARSWPGG